MTGDLAARDGSVRSDRGDGLEIAVVGAGAVGATAAYDLARRGADVTVYDSGAVASGSSGQAAGVCYDAVATEPSALAGRFPALRADDVAVAGVTEGAGYADPGAYTACLAENAVAEGATLATHTPVTVETDPPRVVPQDGSSRAVGGVLVAAGAHSKRLLAAAGVPIAMKPYRVQALVTAADVTEPMWYDATAGCYARPHPDGLLAGNGTEAVEADPNTYDRDANPEFAASLTDRLVHRLPDLQPDIQRAWAGLCTATPDREPLVGRLREGLYVATGFQGQGFMRAPATGRRIAEQLLGGSGIDAFDPTRFSGDESFRVREGMSVTDE